MGLLDRVSAAGRQLAVRNGSIDQYIEQVLQPASEQFTYGGVTYTLGGGQSIVQFGSQTVQNFASTLPGHTAALQSSPPAFAAQLVRASVLSQARFVFRNRPGGPNGRKTFGTTALSVLEQPWPTGCTGDLIGRMEWHAGLAGNAFVTNQTRARLRILRPDWVAKVWGSELEPDDPATAMDGTLLGYVYVNGGLSSGNRPTVIWPENMAHWYPLPDPLNEGVGMSWVTPVLREIRGDIAATQHKLMFFANGATPNLVVKGIPAVKREQFDEAVEMMERRHAGVGNAYRTLYLTAGADATVVGSDLRQIDFKLTQGAGETRIASVGRVPAALLGISEGLAGSALNAGNFGQARRLFGDTWVAPTLANLANSLAPLVQVPAGAELWFDVADVPLLREDAADAANIVQTQLAAAGSAVQQGWDADAAIAAVMTGDLSVLIGKHNGLPSVQQQSGPKSGGAA